MSDGEDQGDLLPIERDHQAPQHDEPGDTDDRDFDWNDADAVVIERQPRTACYWNPKGQVVLRQESWPDDDVFLFFNLEHVPALIFALKQMLEK